MELKETPAVEDQSLLTSQPTVHIIKSTSKDGRQGKGKTRHFLSEFEMRRKFSVIKLETLFLNRHIISSSNTNDNVSSFQMVFRSDSIQKFVYTAIKKSMSIQSL